MTPETCPYCAQKTLILSGGMFFERGEYDGKRYEEEGSISTYGCTNCGAEIGIVAAPGTMKFPAEAECLPSFGSAS